MSPEGPTSMSQHPAEELPDQPQTFQTEVSAESSRADESRERMRALLPQSGDTVLITEVADPSNTLKGEVSWLADAETFVVMQPKTSDRDDEVRNFRMYKPVEVTGGPTGGVFIKTEDGVFKLEKDAA